MIRIATVLAAVLMVAAAVGLYRFKDNAAEQAARIDSVRAEIARERERIAVLRAEWNYLNEPGRIQELSQRHLELERLQARQIVSAGALPMPAFDGDRLESDGIPGGLMAGQTRAVR